MRPAASGAAATIASDALMNPFDGKEELSQYATSQLMSNSHQTTNAGPRLDAQDDSSVREITLPKRGTNSFLRILPYYTLHDCSVHCHTIYGL